MLNQKQKFFVNIVLSVLGNDGAKQKCQLVSMSYLSYIAVSKRNISKKFM